MPSGQGSSSGTMGGPGIPQPPPGMSFYAAKRVIGDSPWTPELLEQVLTVTETDWGTEGWQPGQLHAEQEKEGKIFKLILVRFSFA